MTISSSIRKAGPFIGNGATVAFPFSFKVFAAAEVLVVQAITTTGVETTKTLTSDYTIALNADQRASPGGTITMLTAPPTGQTLTATSQMANLQPTDLTNAGGFYPAVINDALDRATIQIQQVAEQVGRAVKVSISGGIDPDNYLVSIGQSVTDAANSASDSADSAALSIANIANVNAVAGIAANVTSVAGNATDINAVAGISANITTVAGISANVTSVVGNATNINAVAGNATNINAVNANSANINTVAGSNTAVNTVATNIASVNSAATNMAAIIDAPNQAGTATTQASNAAANAIIARDKAAEAAVSAATAQAVSPDSPIRLNSRFITANLTIGSAYNAASVGPISIRDGVTVTVQDNATWSIN
jgi:hypothetical protein